MKGQKKLNRDLVDEIMVELYADELSMNEIAKEFDISIRHLYNINDGQRWQLPNFHYPVRHCDRSINQGDSDMDMPRELRAIISDLEQTQSALGAILRDLDMIVGTYEDPTNIDSEPYDYDVYEDVKGHVCDTTTVDGG